MANRNWRSGGYQTFNQILTPMGYYQQPAVPYQSDRKTYGGAVARGGGYREDNYKRDRKDFQSNRRDRISPIKRRSPPSYQRSHETHGNVVRKDAKKSSHGGGRYEVKAPRLTFDIKDLSTTSLKFRYPKIYAPSDFFHAHLSAQETFPLYRPMKLGNRCEFQVLSKEVEVISNELTDAEPDDVDYKFSAKVLLMSSPLLPELYKSVCHLSGSGEPKLSLIRNIKFLVGSKGKNEPMAIGGPWSPSLDGSDPEEDPYVLINTAIRTCKMLTGIDLSGCKKWYKFLDIQYHRQSLRPEEGVEKKADEVEGDVDHEHVEVVTIYIPDIWSCEPTEAEWCEIKAKYEQRLNNLINPTVEETPSVDEVNTSAEEKAEEILDEKVEDLSEKTEEVIKNIDGTSDIDLNQMKVTELRAELTARGLEPKGLKLQLIQRLQEAMENDKKKVDVKIDGKIDEVPVELNVTKESEVVKPVVTINQLPEKEQKRLEKLYKMNDNASILVQANKIVYDCKFECMVMSLDSLLDYRGDNQKEHSFEVSLFAEQFNEMLQRDAAFNIYKSIINLPDLVKEITEPDIKKSKLDNEPRKSKVNADIDLYFAFSVFDSDSSGCFRDHELENILHCIGLNLSRSQVKKLLAKIPSKKGNIFYKDIVEREVIEGSAEDIATLKTVTDGNISSLIELAQGNKSFFDEADTNSLSQRSGTLSLLDKINGMESKKLNYELQLSLLNSELHKLKAAEVGSGDVEIHLRDNIKKIQDKLAIEKETLSKLSEVSEVYHGLLMDARVNMDASIKSINEQFEIEKELADAIKAKEEADIKAKEEAAKAKEDAEKAKEEAAKAIEEGKGEDEADKIMEVDSVDEVV